jgi:hypothetical protein
MDCVVFTPKNEEFATKGGYVCLLLVTQRFRCWMCNHPLGSQFVILKQALPSKLVRIADSRFLKITICDLRAADPSKMSRNAGSRFL